MINFNIIFLIDQFNEPYSPLRDIGREFPTGNEVHNSQTKLLVSNVNVQPERNDLDPKMKKDLLVSYVGVQPERNDLDPKLQNDLQNDLLVNYVGPFRNDLERAKAKNKAPGHQNE